MTNTPLCSEISSYFTTTEGWSGDTNGRWNFGRLLVQAMKTQYALIFSPRGCLLSGWWLAGWLLLRRTFLRWIGFIPCTPTRFGSPIRFMVLTDHLDSQSMCFSPALQNFLPPSVGFGNSRSLEARIVQCLSIRDVSSQLLSSMLLCPPCRWTSPYPFGSSMVQPQGSTIVPIFIGCVRSVLDYTCVLLPTHCIPRSEYRQYRMD